MQEVIYTGNLEKVGLYKPNGNTTEHIFKTKIKCKIKCIVVSVDT